MTTTPRALLFDLGGVLIDIDFGRALDAWAGHSSLPPERLRQAFTFDDAYRRHERGELDAAGYFAHLADALSLSADAATIERGWNAIFVGEIEAARRLVEAVRPRVGCHAFTNTNAAHAACWRKRFPRVVACFGRVFASHEIGRRKPERAAFDHVARALGVPPGDILFFDDLPDNVDGARAAGLRAVTVRGPPDVADALVACGLLAPDDASRALAGG